MLVANLQGKIRKLKRLELRPLYKSQSWKVNWINPMKNDVIATFAAAFYSSSSSFFPSTSFFVHYWTLRIYVTGNDRNRSLRENIGQNICSLLGWIANERNSAISVAVAFERNGIVNFTVQIRNQPLFVWYMIIDGFRVEFWDNKCQSFAISMTVATLLGMAHKRIDYLVFKQFWSEHLAVVKSQTNYLTVW